MNSLLCRAVSTVMMASIAQFSYLSSAQAISTNGNTSSSVVRVPAPPPPPPLGVTEVVAANEFILKMMVLPVASVIGTGAVDTKGRMQLSMLVRRLTNANVRIGGLRQDVADEFLAFWDKNDGTIIDHAKLGFENADGTVLGLYQVHLGACMLEREKRLNDHDSAHRIWMQLLASPVYQNQVLPFWNNGGQYVAGVASWVGVNWVSNRINRWGNVVASSADVFVDQAAFKQLLWFSDLSRRLRGLPSELDMSHNRPLRNIIEVVASSGRPITPEDARFVLKKIQAASSGAGANGATITGQPGFLTGGSKLLDEIVKKVAGAIAARSTHDAGVRGLLKELRSSVREVDKDWSGRAASIEQLATDLSKAMNVELYSLETNTGSSPSESTRVLQAELDLVHQASGIPGAQIRVTQIIEEIRSGVAATQRAVKVLALEYIGAGWSPQAESGFLPEPLRPLAMTVMRTLGPQDYVESIRKAMSSAIQGARPNVRPPSGLSRILGHIKSGQSAAAKGAELAAFKAEPTGKMTPEEIIARGAARAGSKAKL